MQYFCIEPYFKYLQIDFLLYKKWLTPTHLKTNNEMYCPYFKSRAIKVNFS